MTGLTAPSQWVLRFAHLVGPDRPVLDLACGSGRHARWFAGMGHDVVGVDRDPDALASLAGIRRVRTVRADIEVGPWPFAPAAFAGVIVTNYLHRPLFPLLRMALAPAGVLIYETFAIGNERYGRPSNLEFLLRPGELLCAAQGLRVLAYEDCYIERPKPALVQRVCAIRAEHVPARPIPGEGEGGFG